MIIASTAAIYEPDKSMYGITKLAAESIAKHFDNTIIIRLYNVYGPGSKSVVNKFIKLIKANKPIKLNGNTIRDYIYIDDVVRGLIDALSLNPIFVKGRILQLGTGLGTRLTYLAENIGIVFKKKVKMIHNPPINEIQISEAPDLKSNFITLMDGIRKLCGEGGEVNGKS